MLKSLRVRGQATPQLSGRGLSETEDREQADHNSSASR